MRACFVTLAAETCHHPAVAHIRISSLSFVFLDKAAPPEMPIVIDHMALKDILGPPLFDMEVRRRPSAGSTH